MTVFEISLLRQFFEREWSTRFEQARYQSKPDYNRLNVPLVSRDLRLAGRLLDPASGRRRRSFRGLFPRR
jgi:hypothetical protein